MLYDSGSRRNTPKHPVDRSSKHILSKPEQTCFCQLRTGCRSWIHGSFVLGSSSPSEAALGCGSWWSVGLTFCLQMGSSVERGFQMLQSKERSFLCQRETIRAKIGSGTRSSCVLMPYYHFLGHCKGRHGTDTSHPPSTETEPPTL